MRLTCPNCGAQYEVPPEAIPPAGREVQCSSCQTTWFERGAASAPQPLEPWESRPAVEGDQEEEDDLAEVRSAPQPEAAPRPRVDPEVSRILREEAQREQEARAAAADPAPAPIPAPELAAPRPTPPRRLHARGGGGEAAPAAAVGSSDPTPALRSLVRPARSVEREVDPDRIASTLRREPERAAPARPARPAPAPADEAPRTGFARGFVGALLVLVVLAALYLLRDDITAALPAAAAVLDPYAEAVDAAREGLNDLIGRLLGATPVE